MKKEKLTTEEIVNRWRPTGLLDDLPKTKVSDCAISLQKLSELLIKRYDGVKDPKAEIVCGTILPIMRRLYSEKVVIPTAGWLLRDFIKFNKNHPKFDITLLDPYRCRQCERTVVDSETMCVNAYIKNLKPRLKK